MKKIIFLCLLFFSLTSHAARQENNISQMIVSLHHELLFKWKEVEKSSKATDLKLSRMETDMRHFNDNSKQCLMNIYSTDENSFQEVAFASQNAVDQYDCFSASASSYISMLREYQRHVYRQDSLTLVLKSVDIKMLKPNNQKLLAELLSVIAKQKSYDIQILQRLKKLRPVYDEANKRFHEAVKISQQKYEMIRSNVLSNFDGNIIDIISDWDGYMLRMDESKAEQRSVDQEFNAKVEKFGLMDALGSMSEGESYSSWGTIRMSLVFLTILLLFLRAFVMALLIILARWIIKRTCKLKFWSRTHCNAIINKVQRGVTYLNGVKTLVFSTVWINLLIWLTLFNSDDGHGEEMMDSIAGQVLYFIVILAVTVTFFVMRYSGRQLWRSLAVCLPTMIAFIYTLISIIMVMSDYEVIVETTFLYIILFVLQLLIFWLWHKHQDMLMARISYLCIVFIGLTMVVALIGLQFLSTMVVVFWCAFMVCLMILTSLKFYFDRLIDRYHINDGSVKSTWWVPVINRVLYPMAWIYAALLSCRMACSVYSLDDFLGHLLNTYFRTPLGNISLNINLLIFICWTILIAAYLSEVIYHFVDSYHKSRGEMTWEENNFFNKNTIRFLVWGVAIINIMMHMGFNLQWVGYCMAGISTGIGFASRELLENLIYGLTLRSGQLKIGDWIECEGIRGQIKSIGLLSTRMDSVEGSVITFTNGRLLNMNYQNITLNHGYELLHTDFCVNFGEDIERLRHLLIEGYSKFNCYDKTRPVTVLVKQINNQQVDLDFKVWILASERIKMAAFNKEYVYNVLNANGIEYPYPYVQVKNV